MSNFGNNIDMTRNFAADTHIIDLLKMTNDMMIKLKKEVQ
jgi:hypothetical protein